MLSVNIHDKLINSEEDRIALEQEADGLRVGEVLWVGGVLLLNLDESR